MKEGLIYYAVGEKYIAQALEAIKSVKRVNSEVEIALMTNQQTGVEDIPTYIHKIILEEPLYGNFFDKPKVLLQSPFERTIFIDTDTYVVNDFFADVFKLLDKFDLAISRAPGRYNKMDDIINIPRSFSMLNTGVIAFRRNSKVVSMLKAWQILTLEHVKVGAKRVELGFDDQKHFREALYNSDLNFYMLPPEYNFRLNFISFASKEVNLIHDHEFVALPEDERLKIIKKLNKSWAKRVWHPLSKKVIIPRTVREKVKKILNIN